MKSIILLSLIFVFLGIIAEPSCRAWVAITMMGWLAAERAVRRVS